MLSYLKRVQILVHIDNSRRAQLKVNVCRNVRNISNHGSLLIYFGMELGCLTALKAVWLHGIDVVVKIREALVNKFLI